MITMTDKVNVDFCAEQMARLPNSTCTLDDCVDKFHQKRRSSQTIAGNFRLSSSCSGTTVVMVLLGSLVWYGVVVVTFPGVLKGESAIANEVGTSGMVRETPSIGAMKGEASVKDRLADLERSVARIEERAQALEHRNRELELAQIVQNTKPQPHLEQLVEQLERGLSFLFPDFGVSSADEASMRNLAPAERTTEKRIQILRDYLGNRAAEFAALRPDMAQELRQDEEPEPDLGAIGLALRQLTSENANLKRQVEELNERLDVAFVDRQHVDMPNTLAQELEDEGIRDLLTERAKTSDTRKSAFSVASSQPQFGLQEQAQAVNFDHNLTNKGGDFNFDNNSFVCRIPGFYFFTVTLRTYDHRVLGVVLMKNDDVQVSINTDQSDRSISSTQSVILRLSQGDTVWLRVPPSANYAIYSDSMHYTTFSGFLVFNTTT